MAAKVENRNIHENGPSVLKNRAKRFKRIKGQAHTAAEIVAGPDRDKSENNRRQINDPGKYFINSAVTAYCYQSYRILGVPAALILRASTVACPTYSVRKY